jgi:large subunit ribosomal protein L25
MKIVEINGVVRPAVGKKGSKIERKKLFVPCVLYGQGSENLHFSAFENEFLPLVYSHEVCTVNLNVEGKTYSALLKDIQFHPVTDKILHIDFYLIKENRKVNIGVPVHVHGFAEGVRAGGKLHLEHRKMKVKALLKDLPDHIDLDVTDLGVGKVIRIGDINIPNVEFTEQKSIVVVSVKMTRATKELEGTETPGVAPVAAEEPPKK